MKRTLKDPSFALIPEGEQTVQITKVDESDYAKFAKLVITIADKSGATARVNLNFENDDGTPNEICESIYTRICRAALNDQTLDEVDSSELEGCFVDVEIIHREGKNGSTFANVNKWLGTGKPFKTVKASPAPAAAPTKKDPKQILAEMRARKAAG